MRGSTKRHIKEGILYFCLMLFSILVLAFSFESGQRKVDRWERETSRYGEGLR